MNKDKTLNIAVFTDSFLPGTGGTENAILNMCRGLAQLGHHVKIYCPTYHNPEENNFKEFEVFRVPSMKLSSNDMMAMPSRCKKRLIKDVEEFNPDIIHYCTASGMAKTALKIGKKLKKPVVATMHTKFKEAFYCSSKSKLITYAMIKTLAHRLNKTTCGVTTVSNDMAEQLKLYGYKKQPIVIRNGAPFLEKHQVTENVNKDDVFTFLFCGHISKLKNIHFSIKCLSKLKNNYGFDKFRFVLIGGGDYKKQLQKLARKLGIQDKLEFKGLVRDKALLSKLYSEGNLFLLPSPFDNDPLVVIEAAKNEVPTLALHNYGCGERITDNVNGYLANYNEADYTKRIWEIIQNKELYAKVKKNASNLQGLSWKEIAKQYCQLYNSAIKNFKNTH